MIRTVGVTLRRTVGGGVIVALGLGALSSAPHQLVSVAAASAVLPLTGSIAGGSIQDDDRPLPFEAPAAVQIYVLAAPTPPAVVRSSAPGAAPLRPKPRTPVRLGTTSAARPVSGAANGFAYGYCTWWVAHKRYVPWRGNAAQWWWNARAFGFGEGSVPRAGAIMVMGISATSPQGHVGYVESVNANGSFLVSEMNWWGAPGGGWGRVDYRTVSSMRGILGFIY